MVGLTDFVYRYLALPLLWIAARIASLTNAKLRRRFADERSWTVTSVAPLDESSAAPLEESLITRGARGVKDQRILFHASSMGEFEQLLPVIRRTRLLRPTVTVVASFFSPSGYNHGLRTPEVDVCTYLPFDTQRRVTAYLDAIHPDVIVIDRYDVWRTFVLEACKRHIPIMLINATYPSSGRGLLRAWFADTYRRLTFISAVTIADGRKLSELTRRPVSVLDDTRIDRVIERCSIVVASVENLRRPDLITIVVGSSWPKDEDLAIEALCIPGVRLVIVPHEPTPQVLAAMQVRLTCTLLSVANETTSGHILVDSVGQLLGLYAVADAAFVGGGFGAGVHSVTEPAVYGMPIATGPNIERSADALRLHDIGLLTVVRTTDEMRAWYKTNVSATSMRANISHATRTAMVERAGASEIHAERIANLVDDSK